MIKKLLLLGAFAMSAGTALAQDPIYNLPAQQFKQKLRNKYQNSDTAQAIITLYSRRQAGGASWMAGGVLSAVRLSIGTTTRTTSYGGYTVQNDSRGNIGGALLLATPFLAYGFGKTLHYSNGNLEKVLAAYAAGEPLPRSLRRKLKPRFFSEPIIQYKDVKYKSASN